MLINGQDSVADVARRLDEDGFVRLEHVLSDAELALVRKDVDSYLDRHGRVDRDLFDLQDWECPVAYALATDPDVERLLEALAHDETTPPGRPGYVRRVFRIFSSPGSRLSKPQWHYDGCSITMIVPLIMPEDGSGGFAALPNNRPHRQSRLTTLAEKQVCELGVLRPWINRRFRKSPAARKVTLVPGDAYLFRGYRTLHSVMPLTPHSLRASILLQYGEPYGADSRLLGAARRAKHHYLHLRGGTKPGARYS